MKGMSTKKDQSRKVEELHYQTNEWKSNLHFMRDELSFITHLLNSYVFEPNTPNLFERLQNYQQLLKKVKLKEKDLQDRISKHESDLGGMLECRDAICDSGYYKKHEALKAKITECTLEFRQLKSEIFNYAGGILKKRKPRS
jgi:hypothetical protein